MWRALKAGGSVSDVEAAPENRIHKLAQAETDFFKLKRVVENGEKKGLNP